MRFTVKYFLQGWIFWPEALFPFMKTIVIISRTGCSCIFINCLSRLIGRSRKISLFIFLWNNFLFRKLFSFFSALFDPFLNFLIVLFQCLLIVYQSIKVLVLKFWGEQIFFLAEIGSIFNFFIFAYVIISWPRDTLFLA